MGLKLPTVRVEFASRSTKTKTEENAAPAPPAIGEAGRCRTVIPGKGPCIWPAGHGTDHDAEGWDTVTEEVKWW